jgi:hypothetical protein
MTPRAAPSASSSARWCLGAASLVSARYSSSTAPLRRSTWFPRGAQTANTTREAPRLGKQVISRDTCITLKEDAARSMAGVREVLRDLSARRGPTIEDAGRHAEGAGARGRMSKFDPCLPEELFRKLVVESVLDVEGARRAVGSGGATHGRGAT